LRVVNDLHSLADNNLKAPAYQTAQGQSSFAGQWDNSLGFVGVSSKTYGTLTFGRVSALSTGVISAYDPVSSIAFSLLGFSGPFTGFGTSELSPVNTGFVYRWGYQNFRVAGLAQVGGYTIGNGTMGEYQGQVGATFGGLSIDAILSYAKDAVSQLSYGGSGLPTGYDPNTILKATLSNNTGFLLAAKYKWNPFEVYGGYIYTRLADPSDAFTNGFPTIAQGIFVPPGAVNSTDYNVNRILNTFWTGAQYDVSSDLNLSTGIYYQTQNNYLQPPAICIGSGTGTSSRKCAGSLSGVSAVINYKPVKRVIVYAGVMVSNVTGGLASGYFKSQNIDPGAGIRVRF